MEINSLRRKYINSTLTTKTCNRCLKEYPRTNQFFYPTNNKTKSKKGWVSHCIRCVNERTMKWRKRNKERIRIVQKEYLQTEPGYFSTLFNSMKKSIHYVPEEFPDRASLIEHFNQQKKKYGMKCPATGVEMTMINKGLEGKRTTTPTNISGDRILCYKDYTRQNLIFTCWKYNNDKNSMTPKMAKAFLRIVKERYGTDEME